jgi:transcriptional regulator with XRE-family HTH domain
LDLGLTQRQAAARIGGGEAALYNWERGRTAPALWFYPGILAFLGYDPRPAVHTVGERLRWYRQQRGTSREVLAQALGVDEGTLARWELGRREPWGRLAERVRRFLVEPGLAQQPSRPRALASE